MDIRTSYGRWFRRRFAVLVSALAAATLLVAHLALAEDLRSSARIALIATAALVGSLFLVVGTLTLYAHRLHRAGRRGDGRVLRRLLEPAERLVAPALLLLLPVAIAPGAFRRPESDSPPDVVVRGPARLRIPPPPAPSTPPAPAPSTAPEAPTPPAAPAVDELPEAPPVILPAAAAERPDEGGDNDVFRLRSEDLAVGTWPAFRIELERFGVPDDGDPLEGRPFAVEMSLLMLWEDDAAVGSGMAIRLDLPTSGGPILRLSTLYLSQSENGELLEGTPAFALSHTAFDAVFRVAGGTRRAALDLYVSVGLAVDAVDQGDLDDGARLSPHLAVDLALWQHDQVGFVFRAGQTIPTSITGASAAVTELSAALRIDFSERITLRAGWQHLVVHLRDYEGAFGSGGQLADLDRDFSGPMLGLELRF